MYFLIINKVVKPVAVFDSLDKALSTFTKGNVITGDMEEKTITIKRVELITNDGNTLVYIVDADNNIYYSEFKAEMLLLEEGQTITIKTDGSTFLLND